MPFPHNCPTSKTARWSWCRVSVLIVILCAAQQRRLAELMGRRSLAGQQGGGLADFEQAELEALIEMEVRAAGQRAAALADELGR